MAHLAVWAMGSDRPGIAAAVTGVLLEAGCNLEDGTMANLRGQFAIMLVVSAPEDTGASDLEAALGALGREMELVVAVREIGDAGPAEGAGESWSVSVYGADKPGIVHRVTRALADLGVNIVGLSTRVIGEDAEPVYVMLLDVTLPNGIGADRVRDRLRELGGDLGVDCSMHPSDADVL